MAPEGGKLKENGVLKPGRGAFDFLAYSLPVLILIMILISFEQPRSVWALTKTTSIQIWD
jgi:hypothetical protein